jgi:DNA-binding phage protein
MALTRDFRETVLTRVQTDGRFRRALLIEAIDAFLSGDVATGKAVLRDYVNATIGFEGLAEKLGKDSKSLHRMLGPRGNPRAENIFAVIRVLQDEEDITLHVRAGKREVA